MLTKRNIFKSKNHQCSFFIYYIIRCSKGIYVVTNNNQGKQESLKLSYEKLFLLEYVTITLDDTNQTPSHSSGNFQPVLHNNNVRARLRAKNKVWQVTNMIFVEKAKQNK